MIRISLLLCLAILFSQACTPGEPTLQYPETARVDVRDTFFGAVVEDPYRWLEQSDSDAVQKWVDAQNKLTFPFLDALESRDFLRQRLTSYFDYERVSSPFKAGPYIFFCKNEGLQEQSPLFVQKGPDAEPELLLDPLELSSYGRTSISRLDASPDGKYLAVSISRAGSDWRTIRVMDVAGRRFLDDEIKHVKFSAAAWKGNTGFYYSRYDDPAGKKHPDAPDQFHRVHFHKIGSDQENDRLVHRDTTNPFRNFHASVTESGDHLILYGSESGSRDNLLWY
jgi:prolyl oligopeptidase